MCVCLLYRFPQDVIKEMKRRFKLMNHQIEQLKDEITVMDHSLVRSTRGKCFLVPLTAGLFGVDFIGVFAFDRGRR